MKRKPKVSNPNLVEEIKKDLIMYLPKYKDLFNRLIDYEYEDKLSRRESNSIIDFYYEQESKNKKAKRVCNRYNRRFKKYMGVWLSKDDIYNILEIAKSYGFIETELEGTTYDVSVVPRTIVLKRTGTKTTVYLVITLYIHRNEYYRVTINAVDRVF